MLSEYKKTKEKVEFLLRNFPGTRNSDKELIFTYGIRFCNPTQDISGWLKQMPSLEGITRARREVQKGGKGLYLSDKQIQKAREKNCQEMAEHHSR